MKHSKEFKRGYLAALQNMYMLMDSPLFEKKTIRDSIGRGVKELSERSEEK